MRLAGFDRPRRLPVIPGAAARITRDAPIPAMARIIGETTKGGERVAKGKNMQKEKKKPKKDKK